MQLAKRVKPASSENSTETDNVSSFLKGVKSSPLFGRIEHGEVIERGNHEYLLAEKGIYCQLYAGTSGPD